jgi:hypothetical protein
MAFSGNQICDTFKTELLEGLFDFKVGTTDVFKIALYTADATLNASTTAYTTANEVVAAGYTAGGIALTPVVASSSGVSFVSFDNVTWNAVLTARGALVYKEDTGNPAVFVLDFGSNKVSSSSFVVQFPPANNTSAILRLA